MDKYDIPTPNFKVPEFNLDVTPGAGEEEFKPFKAKQLPVEKTQPYEAPVDNLGFIKNLPKSVLNLAKNVFIDFPVSVGEAAYHYAKNPDQWHKDFQLLMDKPGDTGSFLRHQVTDYYTDGLWKNFNDDPARALSDAAALLDGVGLVGKLGTTGGALARVGEVAGTTAKFVDPLRVTGMAANKLLGKGLRAVGYGPLTPEVADLYNHIHAREGLHANIATADELKIPLTEDENGQLSKLLNLGDPIDIQQTLDKGGPVAERYRLARDRVSLKEEPYIREHAEHFGMDNPDEHFIKSKAKAVEAWSNEHMDLPIPAEEAEQLIRDKVLDPTYNTMYRETKGTGPDLWEIFNKETNPAKTLGRAETRFANGEYIKDLDEISARQIRDFHRVKAKLDFLSGLKERLTEKNQILVGNGEDAIEKAKLLGYRELPEAFYKWYYENYNKGTSVLVEKLREAAKAGLPQADTLKALREALTTSLATGDIQHYAAGGKVFVPDYIAAWVNQELAPISNFSRVYNQWQSRYKSVVTVFNPRYWAPVLFGNALVATIYGLSPDMLRLARKFRGDLPPTLQQVSQHEVWLRDLNFFDRKAKSFGQAASMLDNIYRQGMFGNEVLKDSYARTKLGIQNFFHSQEQIEQAIKYFGAAPERYASTLTKLGDLHDQVAVGIIKGNKEYTRLQRLEGRMANEMARLMEFRQSGMKELEIGLRLREDKLGPALATLPPKYQFFAEGLITQIKAIRSMAKNAPDKIDVHAALGALDSAVKMVDNGRPDLLRYAVKQLKKAVDGTSPLVQRRSRLSVIADMVGRAEENVRTETANSLRRLVDIGDLEKAVPGLRTDSQVASRAAAVGNMFYGSMDNLLPFEKRLVKQIVPFYTFTKAMTMMAFKFPFLYPKRTFIMSHLAKAWNEIMDDEDAYLPAWTKNYIPVLGHADGSITLIRVGSLGPLSNVRMNKIGEQALPSVYDIASQNPFIRLSMEMKGGIPEWSARPLSPGDKAVKLSNGEVIEWTGTGFKKVIAQPSIWKSVSGLFPQSQLVDQLLHRYAQTDRGWLFSPEPISSPSGAVKYPKELLDSILSFAVPTTTVQLETLKQQQRVEVARVVKEFESEMRTAPPDRRASLIESLRAWSTQKKKGLESND